MMMAAAAAGLVLAGCRVDQAEEVQPPDIQVEPGQLPRYDTEPGQARPDTDRVVVPDVDVQRPGEPGQSQQRAPQR
jgi:hypothetical protein|nr:MAG: hypothetical protein DIU52_08960 [bacterium]